MRVVHKDIDVSCRWIRIKRGHLRELHIAICYFSPTYTRFAPLKESAHLPLYDDIMKFSTAGNIVILENFNVQTKDDKKPCLTQGYDEEGMAEDVGLKVTSSRYE